MMLRIFWMAPEGTGGPNDPSNKRAQTAVKVKASVESTGELKVTGTGASAKVEASFGGNKVSATGGQLT